jgi:transposase-like protein
MARRSFTAEFKEQAARQVIQGGRSFRDVARDLGIDASSLRHWVRMPVRLGALHSLQPTG